jgi:hypothetical protein
METGRASKLDNITVIAWALGLGMPTVYAVDYLFCRWLLGLKPFSTATTIISCLAGAAAAFGGAKIAVRRAKNKARSDDDDSSAPPNHP